MKLKPCPLCGGDVQWCDVADPNEPHICHFILCDKCDATFNLCNTAPGPDTIDELKQLCADKWNRRATEKHDE